MPEMLVGNDVMQQSSPFRLPDWAVCHPFSESSSAPPRPYKENLFLLRGPNLPVVVIQVQLPPFCTEK
jgi:hypothetical protein